MMFTEDSFDPNEYDLKGTSPEKNHMQSLMMEAISGLIKANVWKGATREVS